MKRTWPSFLGLFVCLVSLSVTGQAEQDIALQRHQPILIHGVVDMNEANGVLSGTGTEDDPYLIEGWDIEAAGFTDGIFVDGLGANVWLVIRNCRTFDADDSGIRLYAIQHALVEHCTSLGNDRGITLDNAKACTIATNECLDNRLAGITLWGSVDNHIFNNHLLRNGLSGGHHGFGCGIYMDYSTGNRVDRNFVEDNYYGILLGKAANKNGVFGNTIKANQEGVVISAALYGNYIFLNNFLDNAVQGRDLNSPGENRWDAAGTGNFWGQYTAWDGNGDGLGDTAIRTPKGARDRHPLMRPWKPSVVAMGIKFSGPDEFVTVRNWSGEDVDLTGWQLQSVDLETKEVKHAFSFPDGCILPADGKLKVHSGPEAVGQENDPCGSSEMDIRQGWRDMEDGAYVWNDLGGIVRLVNDKSEIVDEYEYHWWMGG